MRSRLILGLGLVTLAVLLAPRPGAAVLRICEIPRDYPTLQEGINDPTCGEVHAAKRVYTEQLSINRSLTLSGSGERETFIQAPATMTEPRAIIRVTGRRVKVKIKHFTIQGPTAGDSLIGIRLEPGNRVTLRDSIIADVRQEPLGSGGNFIGIHAGGPSTGVPPTILIAQNNRIEGYQGAGIIVEGKGTDADIYNNLIAGTGDRAAPAAKPVGIVVRDSALATIYRNDVVDNRYDPADPSAPGILVSGAADHVVLSNNNVDRNDIGIWVVATNETVLYRNAIDNPVADGIVLENRNLTAGATTDRHTLRYNVVLGAGGVGLRLMSSNGSYLQTNQFRAGLSDGIFVTSACDFQVDSACTAHQPAASGNLIIGNRTDINQGWGIRDLSTGTRTGGTANTYRGDYCLGNVLGKSSPAGLCR